MNYDDMLFKAKTMSLPIVSDWFRRERYYYCVLQNPSSPTEGLMIALQSNQDMN